MPEVGAELPTMLGTFAFGGRVTSEARTYFRICLCGTEVDGGREGRKNVVVGHPAAIECCHEGETSADRRSAATPISGRRDGEREGGKGQRRARSRSEARREHEVSIPFNCTHDFFLLRSPEESARSGN